MQASAAALQASQGQSSAPDVGENPPDAGENPSDVRESATITAATGTTAGGREDKPRKGDVAAVDELPQDL